jgi:hypothetical protein
MVAAMEELDMKHAGVGADLDKASLMEPFMAGPA